MDRPKRDTAPKDAVFCFKWPLSAHYHACQTAMGPLTRADRKMRIFTLSLRFRKLGRKWLAALSVEIRF